MNIVSTTIIAVLAALVALGIGGLAGYVLRSTIIGRRVKSAEAEAQRILKEAEEAKRRELLEAKEEALKAKAGAEAELRERRQEVQRQERRLSQKEESLERRMESLERKEREVAAKEQGVHQTKAELEDLKRKQVQQLESISSLSQSEARDILLKKTEEEIKHELARRYYELEKQAKEEAEQKARKAVTLAIHRLATDVVSESSTTVIPLPNDEMKGRLIGREGRNIRALEALTGVDIIIDDTPQVVTISCFDPLRREVARVALEKLIMDGRIQPARIEEVVERAQKELDETVQREGEKAVFEASVQGLNPELIKLLGRLKYRFSYGENVLKHSVEVALIAGMLAAEIGADIQVAKAGGLLHDIGKALSHEVEGPHAEIGAEVASKHGINPKVHAAIMEHHDEEKGSVEAFLVAAADAISAARPGARKENVEMYMKRLSELEEVAKSFPGIEKAFAIQAGREVRLMVKPDQIDDVAAANLARDIAKRIEEKLVYPGQIKVTVIRETRSVEYAR